MCVLQPNSFRLATAEAAGQSQPPVPPPATIAAPPSVFSHWTVYSTFDWPIGSKLWVSQHKWRGEVRFLFDFFTIIHPVILTNIFYVSVGNESHRYESAGRHHGKRCSHRWDCQRSKGQEKGMEGMTIKKNSKKALKIWRLNKNIFSG